MQNWIVVAWQNCKTKNTTHLATKVQSCEKITLWPWMTGELFCEREYWPLVLVTWPHMLASISYGTQGCPVIFNDTGLLRHLVRNTTDKTWMVTLPYQWLGKFQFIIFLFGSLNPWPSLQSIFEVISVKHDFYLKIQRSHRMRLQQH